MKTNRTFPVVLLLALANGTAAWAEPPGEDKTTDEEPTAPSSADDAVAQAEDDEDEPVEAAERAGDEDEDDESALNAIVPPGTLSSLSVGLDGESGSISPLPFTIGGGISMVTNVGSLVRPNTQTTDSVSLNFSTNLSYSFESDTVLAVYAGLQKFVTPHGLVRQYEARFGDISVALSQPAFYTIPGAKISLTGSLTGSIPTSDFSRFSGLMTSIDGSLVAARSFGRLSLSYSFGVSKNFHRYTSVVFNPDRYEADALIRGTGAENISETLVAITTGVLPEWSVSNSLSASIRLPANFSTQVGFSLSDSFTYATDSITAEDDLQSEFAEPGRGRSQAMSGRIGLGYRFLSRFSAGVSLSTGGPPKTADNSRFRFPFWDFQGGNLQYTSLSLSLSGSY